MGHQGKKVRIRGTCTDSLEIKFSSENSVLFRDLRKENICRLQNAQQMNVLAPYNKKKLKFSEKCVRNDCQ